MTNVIKFCSEENCNEVCYAKSYCLYHYNHFKYLKNKEKILKRAKDYYSENRDKIKEKTKNYAKYYKEQSNKYKYKYAKENPEKVKKSKSDWKKRNKSKVTADTRRRQTAKLKAIPKWADLEIIAQFYKNCPEGYEVDHIIPLQNDLVCGLHVIDNLQYLKCSENRKKSNKFDSTYENESWRKDLYD